MIKIAHLTSAHPRFDSRIFYRECVSLVERGYDVSLVVADGIGDETCRGVRIFDVGVSAGRLNRIMRTSKRVLSRALELDADVYHLHDPELLPFVEKIKKRNRRVIFDMHESMELQIRSKTWIPIGLRGIVSFVYKIFETAKLRKLNVLIVPNATMQLKLHHLVQTKVIANFPRKIAGPEKYNKNCSKYNIIYSGSLGVARGVLNVLDLFYELRSIDKRYRLVLAGPISKNDFERVTVHPVWQYVDYKGVLSQKEIYNEYSKSSIGLILFNNVGQYYMASALKLFEYMQNGMFVLSPNFGEWIEFNEKYNIGMSVDVRNPKESAFKLNKIADEMLFEVGNKNIQYINDIFNWEIEEQKLFDIYENLFAKVH